MPKFIKYTKSKGSEKPDACGATELIHKAASNMPLIHRPVTCAPQCNRATNCNHHGKRTLTFTYAQQPKQCNKPLLKNLVTNAQLQQERLNTDIIMICSFIAGAADQTMHVASVTLYVLPSLSRGKQICGSEN